MLTWILAVLALFVVQTLLPNVFRYARLEGRARQAALVDALGPRDQMPSAGVYGDRAARAVANMQEALPVFLTLALLHHFRPETSEWAVWGAAVFFGARVVFVPAYVFGIFGLRSVVWTLGWVGQGMMIAALFG
jgi:uncharacterized MAPEG superfamily protein